MDPKVKTVKPFLRIGEYVYRIAADPKRDIKFQQQAEEIVDLLDRHVFGLEVRKLMRQGLMDYATDQDGVVIKGSFDVDVGRFTKAISYKKLVIRFIDRDTWNEQGVGYFEEGKPSIIGLPWIVRAKGNQGVKLFVTNPNEEQTSDLIHEIIHFFDMQRRKGKGVDVSYREDAPLEDPEKYYNDPMEFNAFFQTAASIIRQTAEEDLADLEGDELEEQWVDWLGWDSFEGFSIGAEQVFDQDFLNHLNPKYKRKLDKRLYQLWVELREQYS